MVVLVVFVLDTAPLLSTTLPRRVRAKPEYRQRQTIAPSEHTRCPNNQQPYRDILHISSKFLCQHSAFLHLRRLYLENTMAAMTDIATVPSTTAPPSYVARCSLSLSAGLSVYLSHADVGPSLNPFRCDFEGVLSTLCRQIYPGTQMLSIHPRNYSYVMLALYRLLRHLIPHTDSIAAAAKSTASDAPPSSLAVMDVSLTVMTARIAEVYPGELQPHAAHECGKTARGERPHGTPFTAEALVQPLLTIDAAADASELSAWQRWLISSLTWQQLAGTAVEYIAAEWMELLGKYLWYNAWRRSPIVCLHEHVMAEDPELLQLWLAIGMPADYPPELDTDMRSAYKQQFDQQMRAAVVASAPWMVDAQQVKQRVAEWVSGDVPGGDAVFFRRYHIRPLWHTGVDVSGCELTKVESDEAEADKAMKQYDEDVDDGWERTSENGGALFEDESSMEMEAGIDIVDAANVSRRLIINCRIWIDSYRTEQRHLDVSVRGGGEQWSGKVISSCSHGDGDAKPYQSYPRIQLYWDNDLLEPDAQPNEPQPLSDYVCHGHLHGLSEQQWNEVMGGRLRVSYHSGAAGERKFEQADDEQATRSKDGMFPTRLSDVVDRKQYKRLQRTEIRRMAAIAIRLCMLDEGVDVAVFPCFQPAEMRRQFEAVVQTRLETGAAQLPAALPSDLQGMVAAYNPPLLDVPV